MQNNTNNKYCPDCEMPRSHHIHTWLEELITNVFLPKATGNWSRKLDGQIDAIMENVFTAINLAKIDETFSDDELQLRTFYFIEEAKKHGFTFNILRSRFGVTNHFQMFYQGKKIRFDNLPTAQFANSKNAAVIDDKHKCKQLLKQGGFPVAEGRAFWLWQKNKALNYGESQLGFPLVVKPRSGSVSRHVTTNINNTEQLRAAIKKSGQYSPAFIIEKFVPNSFVHRATIIDFTFLACAKQISAHVIGNGQDCIEELIRKKNNDPRRDEKFLHKLKFNTASESLLTEQGLTLQSIPQSDKTIFLQKDPFMKYGGDIAEVTDQVHPDNSKLFFDIAKYFDSRVVGLDFITADISKSWKNQPSAVLELNSLPCIEMHHRPTYGQPQNPAKALVNMVLKYYL